MWVCRQMPIIYHKSGSHQSLIELFFIHIIRYTFHIFHINIISKLIIWGKNICPVGQANLSKVTAMLGVASSWRADGTRQEWSDWSSVQISTCDLSLSNLIWSNPYVSLSAGVPTTPAIIICQSFGWTISRRQWNGLRWDGPGPEWVAGSDNAERRACKGVCIGKSTNMSIYSWITWSHLIGHVKATTPCAPPEQGNALVAYEIAVNDGKQKETNVRTITRSRIE